MRKREIERARERDERVKGWREKERNREREEKKVGFTVPRLR